MVMERKAECCCGQLSVATHGEPELHGLCHCKNCRKRTGSAFGISSYSLRSNVVNISGEAACYRLHNAEQNHDQERYFCKHCGTTLYWFISTKPDLMGIAGGCFIDPPLREPSYTVNDSQRCGWVVLPEHWLVQP